MGGIHSDFKSHYNDPAKNPRPAARVAAAVIVPPKPARPRGRARQPDPRDSSHDSDASGVALNDYGGLQDEDPTAEREALDDALSGSDSGKARGRALVNEPTKVSICDHHRHALPPDNRFYVMKKDLITRVTHLNKDLAARGESVKKRRVRWRDDDIPEPWQRDIFNRFIPLLRGVLAYEVPFTAFSDEARDKLFRYTVRAHGGQTPKTDGPVVAAVSPNWLNPPLSFHAQGALERSSAP